MFYKLLAGEYNASDYHEPSPREEVSELYARVKGHTSHCFDYIRQGIQCAGDITLEGPSVDLRQQIIGMGTMHHSCKSFVSKIVGSNCTIVCLAESNRTLQETLCCSINRLDRTVDTSTLII